jgi:hypothetical protein
MTTCLRGLSDGEEKPENDEEEQNVGVKWIERTLVLEEM